MNGFAQMQNNAHNILKKLDKTSLNSLLSAIEQDFIRELSLKKVTTGFELEFYFLQSPSESILLEISRIDGVCEIKKELGDNQFEITTIPQVGFVKSCEILEHIRTKTTEICKKAMIHISFDAVVNNEIPPSSLQLSVCLYKDNSDIPSSLKDEFFKDIVQNLTENVCYTIFLTSPSDDCFKRISNSNFTKKFKNSPTHATWGTENRTVAIRIASAPNTQNAHNRIELRTPSPHANPYYISLSFIASAFCTAKSHHEQTFIDSHLSCAKPLSHSQNDALIAFDGSSIEKKIEHYLQKYGI